MARFVIRNINFNAEVSPNRFTSKYAISEDAAYLQLFNEQKKMEKKGWAIVRTFNTGLCDGIQMSKVASDGIDYHCEIFVRL